MGLCSGADHSIEAALSMGARAVLAINPVFAAKPAQVPGCAEPKRASYLASLSGAAGVLGRTSSRRLARYAPPGLVRRLSDLKWWLVHRAGAGTVPAFVLGRLAQQGVDTLVVCSKDEGWWVQRGEGGTLRRLQEKGGFRLEVFPGYRPHAVHPGVAQTGDTPAGRASERDPRKSGLSLRLALMGVDQPPGWVGPLVTHYC